ncbi:hypothetical protein M0P25_03850 [archaeon]|nr:hypothetical protein [archaeon]MCK9439413.1 hypothetical protein [Patescibacteria group bacterium]
MADSTTIISRLASRFNNSIQDREKPDFLTRDIGGHWRNNQPYISGYFQVVFGLPLELFGGADNVQIASKWLHSTCEGFTPHTQMLTKVDTMGQGQVGASFVANVTTTREFTLTFREMQNQPILNIIRQWCAIFDPFTGVSPLSGNKFIPQNYKGWAAVAQTKPVRSDGADLAIEDLEECYIYQGVFPTTPPIDTAAASDITANDTIQLSVPFSFDGSPLTSSEPKVAETVINLLKSLKYMGNADSTYAKFHDVGTAISAWGAHSGSVNSQVTP